MPGVRRLWTGPHGSALRERVLDEWGSDPSGVWLVPSDLARNQVLRTLALRHRVVRNPRVWTWGELWQLGRDARDARPVRLTPAAARAALVEAIARARREGELGDVATVVDWPGFRRRLVARIAAWTQAQRSLDAAPPSDEPAERAQW